MTCHIVASNVIHLMMTYQAANDYGKCLKFELFSLSVLK